MTTTSPTLQFAGDWIALAGGETLPASAPPAPPRPPAATAVAAASDDDTPHATKSTLVEDATLGYRVGMTTEVRIAPKWGNAVSEYLRYLTAIDRSPGTIYIRSYQLRVFSQAFRSRSPWTLTAQDIEAFMASQGHHARNTRRAQLIAIRGLYKYGLRSGHITVDPTLYIEPIPLQEGKPRPAEDAAIREALDRAEPRVKMMIFLGAFCGLRRSEIARVHTNDIVPRGGGKFALMVLGKGKKTRKIPLTAFVASMLNDAEPGYLFPSWHRGQVNSDGRVHDEPLTAGHVGVLIREALPAGVTCHQLRHRYASAVYAENRDIMEVKELLGHESVKTTQTYTAVPLDSFDRAIEAAGRLAS